jgi:uncharacterized membrane protein YiaA
MIWIVRAVAIAAFVVVMLLWSTGVWWFVESLPERWVFFGAGIPTGMAISLAIDRLDARLRQRGRSFGD